LLEDVLGMKLSLGAISSVEARVSDALQTPVAEAWEHVYEADVKHTDGTSWLKAGALMCLWTVASAAATVFKVLADGGKLTLAGLFREKVGILISDRANTLTFGSWNTGRYAGLISCESLYIFPNSKDAVRPLVRSCSN